jgi:hypothetical protein
LQSQLEQVGAGRVLAAIRPPPSRFIGVPLQTQADFMDANAQRMRQAFLNGGRSYEALVKAYIQSPAGLYP